MNKKIILIWIFSLLALPSLASAANTKLPPGLVAGDESTSTKAVKGAIAHCLTIESKIQAKEVGFGEAKAKHQAVYNNLKERLAKIADRLVVAGADVADLRADLAVLDEKIAKFNADYEIYAAKMQESRESVCGRSEGDFRDLLKETKTALQQVHKDAADIRAYFVSTVRAEIKKIRDTLKPSVASTTPDTASSTEATSSTKTIPPRPKIKPITPPLPKLD